MKQNEQKDYNLKLSLTVKNRMNFDKNSRSILQKKMIHDNYMFLE